jgi:hypothetical protein
MSVGKLSLTKQSKEKARRSAAPGSGGEAGQPTSQAEKEAEDKLMVTLQVTHFSQFNRDAPDIRFLKIQ